jgi:hypothetical protein
MKKINYISLALILVIYVIDLGAIGVRQSVDLVVFSYNRPLQLFAFLESMECNCTAGLGKVWVLYRTSNKDYDNGYAEVKKTFEYVQFVQQSNPPEDFKPLLCDIVNKSTSDYIACAVDDIIICDAIDFNKCVDALKQTKSLSFYLRLGKNITQSYVSGESFTLPSLRLVADGIYSWDFSTRAPLWRYPHSVDLTIFQKSYFHKAISKLTYNGPNTLEGRWAQKAPSKYKGLCFEHSKMINIPLNLVQNENKNKNMGILSSDCLLELFNAGLKMDISQLQQFENNSPHVHYLPSFKPR